MKILTLSSVFPNPAQPLFGLFVRERMRHVAQRAEVRVVAPVPWSPVDPFARWLKPGFRPARPGGACDNGLPVVHPGFLCFPGFLKSADGYLYYRSLRSVLRRIRSEFAFDLIDAHFAYPDGFAASQLSRGGRVPYTITLRGTEVPYARDPSRRKRMARAVGGAARIITVSRSLAEVARCLGCPDEKLRVIPNGVDTALFHPLDRSQCRRALGLPEGAPILLTVGALVERKGGHRVIDLLPRLCDRFPDLVYVLVGGASPEGDFSSQLRERVARLGLDGVVRFEGSKRPEELPAYYSAADVFVLPTSNEGWANVFLESIACGTPVVTTDVGGNREVIEADWLGTVVPFGEAELLFRAVEGALARDWDRQVLAKHGRARGWDRVAQEVVSVFEEVLGERGWRTRSSVTPVAREGSAVCD